MPRSSYREQWSDLKVRATILDHLDAVQVACTPSEISQAVKITSPRIQAALAVLLETGEVRRGYQPGRHHGRPLTVYATESATMESIR